MNIETMSNYRLNKKARSLFGMLNCYICEEDEGFCVTCTLCESTAAHPMCLWLSGDHIELKETLNKGEQRLEKSIKSDLVNNGSVRQMFHSIGPGSNGGYHEDPALRIKIKLKRPIESNSAMKFMECDEISDADDDKHVDVKNETPAEPGLCL